MTVLGNEPFQTLLRGIFDQFVLILGVVLLDLGKHTAGDSITLSGQLDPNAKNVAVEMEQGFAQLSGGKKEYWDEEGNVTETLEWFSCKHHLLVDVEHAVALVYHVTDNKTADNEKIEDLVVKGVGRVVGE